MDGTIYDFAALSRVAPLPAAGIAPAVAATVRASAAMALTPVGVITNPRSHHNRTRSPERASAALARPDVFHATPRTRAELTAVIEDFARRDIRLLVIDGGDGTIRDVLTCGGAIWGDHWPAVAVLPAGKTNALAVDLGVPQSWTLDDALTAARDGGTALRTPIAIGRHDEQGAVVRGFLFGAGAFVDATALAQRTHRMGAFNGLAVGLAVAWGLTESFFGGTNGRWRRGSRMAVHFDDGAQAMNGAPLSSDRARFIMLTTTFDALPVGLKVFGRARPGMKTLLVDAPANRLVRLVPPLLRGSEDPMLERAGYHRVDATAIDVDVDKGFILDGEMFPGGMYTLRRAEPIRFVTP